MEMHWLAQTPLFSGIAEQELQQLLQCLGSWSRQFARGETVLHAGEVVPAMGLVLSGRVQIEVHDLWGSRSVLDFVEPGMVFAEAYACVPQEPLLVRVVACQDSEILFLQASRLLHTCPVSCPHHTALIRNLLRISAQKNLGLSQRMHAITPKRIRGRLLTYLSFQAARTGSREFALPMNRQQLADYLNVERSALSHELGRMERDGLLTVRRSRFCLTPQAMELAEQPEK